MWVWSLLSKSFISRANFSNSSASAKSSSGNSSHVRKQPHGGNNGGKLTWLGHGIAHWTASNIFKSPKTSPHWCVRPCMAGLDPIMDLLYLYRLFAVCWFALQCWDSLCSQQSSAIIAIKLTYEHTQTIAASTFDTWNTNRPPHDRNICLGCFSCIC